MKALRKTVMELLLIVCIIVNILGSSSIISFAVTQGGVRAYDIQSESCITGTGGDFGVGDLNGSGNTKIGIRLTLVDAKDPTRRVDKGNMSTDILFTNREEFEQRFKGMYDETDSLNTEGGRSTESEDDADVYVDSQYSMYGGFKTKNGLEKSKTRRLYTRDLDWADVLAKAAYLCTGAEAWSTYESDYEDLANLGVNNFTYKWANYSGGEYKLDSNKFLDTIGRSNSSYNAINSVREKVVGGAIKASAKYNASNKTVKSSEELLQNLSNLGVTKSALNYYESIGELSKYEKNSIITATKDAKDRVNTKERSAITEQLVESAKANASSESFRVQSLMYVDPGLQSVDVINNLEALDGQFYGLMTPDMNLKDGEDVIDFVKSDEDWVLLVEPIVHLTLGPNHSSENSYFFANRWSKRFYGTITELFRFIQTENGVDGRPLRSHSGLVNCSSDWMNWKAFRAIWNTWTVPENDEGNKEPGFSFEKAVKDSIETKKSMGKDVSELEGLLNTGAFNRWIIQNTTKTSPLIGSRNTEWKGNCIDGFSVAVASKADVVPSSIIKVAKWYTYETDDTLYNLKVYSYDTVSTPIAIVDEVDSKGNYWRVVGYSTGKEDKVPANGDLSSSFEKYVAENPGSISGDNQDIINPLDDKVVYVRYELTDDVNNSYNIISFYEDTSGKTVKGRVDQLNVPRDTIVSTDGLKEWKITKEPPTNALKFNETPSGRSGSGTPPAPNADENTLYLLYEIDDNVIKLHQDELAHTYKMSDLRGLVHTHNDI